MLFDRASYCLTGVLQASGELPRLVRMNARGEPNAGPGLPHSCGTPRLGVVARRENAQGGCDAGVAGPSNHGVEVGRELVPRQMAVRIDHERQRTRVPGGTSASKLTSVGLPPSVLAASTMPFDSIPISFAGLRLNTITIVRPTSASGS